MAMITNFLRIKLFFAINAMSGVVEVIPVLWRHINGFLIIFMVESHCFSLKLFHSVDEVWNGVVSCVHFETKRVVNTIACNTINTIACCDVIMFLLSRLCIVG
eukprot:Pompholyxophrys_punicea_v1_NODE_100_length_3480_cov_10.916204.p5 type:complete len:103 gc:universal NODE_100_length_3480_cov_10.916204:275-583(+)